MIKSNIKYKIKRVNNKLIIYTNRGTEAGYLNFHHYEDGSGKRNIEISYVSIKPKYRRKGLATLLLQKFIKKHKNKVYISLWTGAELEKTGGYTLYEKCGFTQVLVLNDYYGDGIPTRLFVIKNHNMVGKFDKNNENITKDLEKLND